MTSATLRIVPLTSLLLAAALARPNLAAAQNYTLRETPPTAQPLLVRQTLRATGRLQVPGTDPKTGVALKLAVDGDLQYVTRPLASSPQQQLPPPSAPAPPKRSQGPLHLDGYSLFALAAGRISQLSYKQNKKRAPGPVAPAL